MAAETFKLGLTLKAQDTGVTTKLREINASLDKLNKPFKNFEKAFGNFKESAGFTHLGESFSKVKESVAHVGEAIFSLVEKFAIVGGIAAGALGEMIKSTVETETKTLDLSRATGASVESIQRLGFAFKESGGNSEEFQAVLPKIAKNFGDMRRHAGPLYAFLEKHNKPLLNKILSKKDTGEAITTALEYMSTLKTAQGRMSMGGLIGGKGGAKTLSVMASQGPEKLKETLAETPGIFTKEQAEQAKGFEKTMALLKGRVEALAFPIVGALIPSLKQLGEKFTSFIKDHEEDVKNWAHDFGVKLPGRIEILKTALEGFWEKLLPLRQAFQWIISDSERLQIALGVLAAIMGAQVISSTLGLVSSFGDLSVSAYKTARSIGHLIGKLSIADICAPLISSFKALQSGIGFLITTFTEFGAALLANPITWYVAGIVALIAVGYLVYTYWDKIKAFFITLWDSPAGQLFKFFTPLGMLINLGVTIVKHWQAIKEFFIKAWDNPLVKMLAFMTPVGWLIQAGIDLYNNWEKVGALFETVVGYAKEFFGFGDKDNKFKGIVTPPQISKSSAFYATPLDTSLVGSDVTDGITGGGFRGLADTTEPIRDSMNKISQSVEKVSQTTGSVSDAIANQKSVADFPSNANPAESQSLLSRYNIGSPTPISTSTTQTITKDVTVTFNNLPEGARVDKDPGVKVNENPHLGPQGMGY